MIGVDAMKRLMSIILAATTGAIAPALAQNQAGDVIVMRRTVAPPDMVQLGYARHGWARGDWKVTPACSDTAAASRTISCVNKETRTVVDDSLCQGSKGATTTVMPSYATCRNYWTPESYGDYADSCSDATTRTIKWRCAEARPTGIANGERCGPAPDAIEKVSNYAGCGYAWTSVPDACVGDGVRGMKTSCIRSGGQSVATEAAPEACVATSRPAATKADATCNTTKSTCAIRADQALATLSDLKAGGTEKTFNNWTGTQADAISEATRYCEQSSNSRACDGWVVKSGNVLELHVRSINANVTTSNRKGDASTLFYFAGSCTPKK